MYKSIFKLDNGNRTVNVPVNANASEYYIDWVFMSGGVVAVPDDSITLEFFKRIGRYDAYDAFDINPIKASVYNIAPTNMVTSEIRISSSVIPQGSMVYGHIYHK